MVYPQAYHITFGTFLSRPPGSKKPHVDKLHNTHRGPLSLANPLREARARLVANGEPVRLTAEQRRLACRAIHDIACRYEWTVHAVAVQTDHVHAVISAPRAGEKLRDAIKAAGTKSLNKAFGPRAWWATGGSAKYLWDNSYFTNAVRYVQRQAEF